MSLHLNTVESTRAPENEQAVCVTCGLCCDGTLFGHAELNPGEKGQLPDLIEQNVFMIGEKDYFRLPCLYFSGRCTIYESNRAFVCGSFRCRLLSDMADGKVSPEDALETVREARLMRTGIQEAYKSFSGDEGVLPFMKIMNGLGKYLKRNSGAGFPDPAYEVIQARCNIFQALLIKHFRPTGHFEDLVMKKTETGI